jgi:putative SOS response-associated peptidase YedK
VSLRWGFVPAWAKTVKGPPKINARDDAVSSSPMFRAAFRSRRCLVPANGFYEWETAGKVKQPYLFRRPDERLVAFAGLWEEWEAPDGEVLQSCAVITTDANAVVRPYHDRMPVLVEPDDFDAWLAAGTPPGDVAELLRPYPAEELIAMPVSKRLNNARNEGAELLQPD